MAPFTNETIPVNNSESLLAAPECNDPKTDVTYGWNLLQEPKGALRQLSHPTHGGNE